MPAQGFTLLAAAARNAARLKEYSRVLLDLAMLLKISFNGFHVAAYTIVISPMLVKRWRRAS